MKKLVLALGIFLSAIAICSCSRQELPNRGLDGGGTADGSGGKSPYLFSGILVTNNMEIKANSSNAYGLDSSDRTALLLLLSGDMYYQFNSSTYEEFKRLAEKIGDYPKEEGYTYATPVDNFTTSNSITGISVRALDSYNDTHPQGSDLKDIIRITFESFDHVFDQTLKPTIFGDSYHARYSIEPKEDFKPVKYPALIMGTSFGEKGYKNGLVISLEFLQAPSTPQQKMQVTVLFDNGMELKKDIAVDILELKR